MRFGCLMGAVALVGFVAGTASAVTLTQRSGPLPAALLETPAGGGVLDGFTISFLSEIETLDVGLSSSFVNRIIADEFPVGTQVEVDVNVDLNAQGVGLVRYGIQTPDQKLVDFVAAEYNAGQAVLTLDVTDDGAAFGASIEARPCEAVVPTGALFDLIAHIEAGCAEFSGGWWAYNTGLDRFVGLTGTSDLSVEVRLAAVPVPAGGLLLLTALGAGAMLRRRG